MADFTPTAVSKSSNFVSGTGDTTSDVLADLLDNRTETFALMTDIAEQFYGSSAPSSPNVGTIWRDSANAITKRWNGSAWETDLATALVVGVRNAVLQGHVDSSGNPALFTGSTSALTVQLNATTTPLVITWMDGNDAVRGEKNKIGTIAADSATFWSNLPQNSTVYLYIDLSGSTISGNYSTVAPKYQFNAPDHAAGLDWIDNNTGKVFNSNGAAWTQKYRVYVGTATTDTTKVTAVSVYPYLYGQAAKDIATLQTQKIAFCLSVLPAVGLVSPIFVAPCAMIIQSITIASRTTAGTTQAPSASTNAVLYKDTTSFDSRAFTTADTTVAGLTLAIAAGDKLNLRVSANNTSGGIVSVTYSGIRA